MRGIPKKFATGRPFVSYSSVSVNPEKSSHIIVDYYLTDFIANLETGNNFIPNPLFFECACRLLLFLA